MRNDENISKILIGCAMNVSNILGTGFLEKVYENALCIEMDKCGLPHSRQVEYEVMYKGQNIGKYIADLVVDGRLLVELKALSALRPEHNAQILNYLKASGIPVGLLLNFGTPKLGIKRVVWQHDENDLI